MLTQSKSQNMTYTLSQKNPAQIHHTFSYKLHRCITKASGSVYVVLNHNKTTTTHADKLTAERVTLKTSKGTVMHASFKHRCNRKNVLNGCNAIYLLIGNNLTFKRNVR